MEIKLDLDIETAINDAIRTSLSYESIKKTIKGLVDKAVERSFESAMGWDSPFRKNLEYQIKEAMPTGSYQLPRYNDYIIHVINEEVQKFQQENAQQMIRERIGDLLKMTPKEIKLSEIIEKFVEYFEESDELESDGPTVIIDYSHSSQGGFDLYIDRESGKNKYSCEYFIRTKKDDTKDGAIVWSFEHRGKYSELKSSSIFKGCTFSDEAFLLNLYTGRTLIIVDKTDFSDVIYENKDY
jgi:hypothetical protein